MPQPAATRPSSGSRLDVTFDIEEPPWSMPVVFDNFVWLRDEELLAAVEQDVPTFDGTLPVSLESDVVHDGNCRAPPRQTPEVRRLVQSPLHHNQTTGKRQYLFERERHGLGRLCLALLARR